MGISGSWKFRVAVHGFVILAVSFALGCTRSVRHGPATLPLSAKSTQVYVALRSPVIGAEYQRSHDASYALGGGLIAAAIDSSENASRAEHAEHYVGPIRQALAAYDVAGQFGNSLSMALGSRPWLGTLAVEARALPDPAQAPNLALERPVEQAMVVDTDYCMTTNLDGLRVNARVSLFDAVAARRDTTPPESARYYNELSTTSFLSHMRPNEPVSADTWGNLWIANNGQLLRRALDASLVELAQMIAFDLEQPKSADGKFYPAPEGSRTALAYRTPTEDADTEERVEGYVVNARGPRLWVRMIGGELVSVGPVM